MYRLQRDKVVFDVHHTASSFTDKEYFNNDFNDENCSNEILW